MDIKTTRLAKLTSKSDVMAFRFLHLPFDIRYQIYRICLLDRIAIFLAPHILDLYLDQSSMRLRRNSWGPFEWECNQPGYLNTTLLSVCRIMHEEAAPILYGRNTFYIDDCDECGECENLIKFAERLTDVSRRSLRKLTASFPGTETVYHCGCVDNITMEASYQNLSILRGIANFPNLETLTLKVGFWVTRESLGAVQKIAESIGSCKVILDSGHIKERREGLQNGPQIVFVPFEIDAIVLKEIQRLGWQLVGGFTIIEDTDSPTVGAIVDVGPNADS